MKSKKTTYTAIGVAVVLIAGVVTFVTIRRSSLVDGMGRSPEVVVEAFLAAARNGDLKEARSYWRGPSTTQELWEEYETEDERFEKASDFYAAFQVYQLSYGGRDKGKYHVVWLVARFQDDSETRHPFFLFLDGDRWWIARGAVW